MAEHIFNEKLPNILALSPANSQLMTPQQGQSMHWLTHHPDLTVDHKLAEPLQRLIAFREQFVKPILLVAETAGRREILSELLQKTL